MERVAPEDDLQYTDKNGKTYTILAGVSLPIEEQRVTCPDLADGRLRFP
jgi:hypothetical protein